MHNSQVAKGDWSMHEPLLQLKGINKYYGKTHVLKDVSFDIQNGEFITLLGPSGCGKTTLLRCIAGLERIDAGDILLKNKSIRGLAPNKRNVNTVFQNYALFPHLNVYDNVAYGPRIKRTMTEQALRQKIAQMLELVQMTGYEHRMTNQLSGGQMQRVAIARALINEPDILLLDEPLGALDLKLRKHMQTELAQIQKQARTTFVYVTHDQEEALNMSDRIAVMDHGVIQQLGKPKDIYNRPLNLFIADFIGDRNIKTVTVAQVDRDWVTIRLGDNTIGVQPSAAVRQVVKPGDQAVLAVHMDKVRLSCDPLPNALAGTVLSIHYAGSQIKTRILVGQETFEAVEYLKNECDYSVGETVYLHWQKSDGILLAHEQTREAAHV